MREKYIEGGPHMIIHTAEARYSKEWKRLELSEEELSKKLSKFTVTHETYSNYMTMSKDEQGKIKDVGGFVGGELKGSLRKKGAVLNRSLMTLDIDSGGCAIVEEINDIMDVIGLKGVCYSTHKHCSAKPRLRLLLFFTGSLPNAEEYEYITRKFCNMIGMASIDRTTWQPERLMYWPSRSVDGEEVFIEWDGDYIDKADYLEEGWLDRSKWPRHPLETKEIKEHINGAKQEDPWKKGGTIGAFCRAFPITRLLSELIVDVYESIDDEGSRYTYIGSETSGGVVNYEDKWIYSHHHTDPLGGKLMNAFDIVRIILCGGEEKKALEYCSSIGEVAAACVSEDFDDNFKETEVKTKEKKDRSYLKKLQYNKFGNAVDSYSNMEKVLDNEVKISYDTFRQEVLVDSKGLWKKQADTLENDDIIQIHKFLEKKIKMKASETKVLNAIRVQGKKNRVNLVDDMLKSCPKWDGVPRVETLLTDYFEAADTPYIRAITKKWLAAAVRRVRNPGCKFDHVLTLHGVTDIGKSSFFRILFEISFDDNLSLEDCKTKVGCEKVIGVWCMEIAELAGLKKVDVETIKGFITRQSDRFRPSYGRVVEEHPRQCVFGGTTNSDKVLKDVTGNRRYWLVRLGKKSLDQDKLRAEVPQIWAEVLTYYKDEKLYLKGDLAVEASKMQDSFLDVESFTGIIETFLEDKYPSDWEKRSIDKKIEYLEGKARTGSLYYLENGVTVEDVWMFGLRRDLFAKTRKDSNEIILSLKSLGYIDSNLRRGKQRLFKNTYS